MLLLSIMIVCFSIVTAAIRPAQQSSFLPINSTNAFEYTSLGAIPGLAGYEVLTSIHHGTYWTPANAAMVLRSAWNRGYQQAESPNRQSVFTSMSSRTNIRQPEARLEFETVEDQAETITYDQAIKVIDEVYRRLRQTEGMINSVTFAVRRSGSRTLIAEGKAVGMPWHHHDDRYQFHWAAHPPTYTKVEVMRGIRQVRENLWNHYPSMMRFPVPVTHRARVNPEKPPILITFGKVQLTPSQDLLVWNWRVALSATENFFYGDSAPAHMDALQCWVKRLISDDPEHQTVGQINIRPDHDRGGSSSSGGGSPPASHGGSDGDDDDVSQA